MSERSIKIEDVRIQLTCRECKQTYGYSLQKPKVRKNCRCGNATWHINVEGVGGKKANVRVHIEFEYKSGARETVEPDSIEIEE